MTGAHKFAVPPALIDLEQWVLWRYREGRKVPHQLNGALASSTDPATWSDFESVLGAWRNHPNYWAGLGFVFHESDPYAGIDLDDCLEDGSLKPWAAPIIERLSDTYMEVSPSETGIKLWVRARLQRAAKFPLGDGQVEMYDRARFFCVTGQRWQGAPLEIDDAQAVITWLTGLAPRGGRTQRKVAEVIPHGTQHNTLLSIGGTLAKRGITENEMAALFLEMRKRFGAPVMPDKEILELAGDLVRRYGQ